MARSVASYRPRYGCTPVTRINVAIAVAEDARRFIHEIAATCRALGLEHTGTLAGVGVLTGSVEYGDMGKLWEAPGVVAVEVEGEFRLNTSVRQPSEARSCGARFKNQGAGRPHRRAD
jgi:hypothetical protein